MKTLLPLLPLLCASCVTSGDLARIEQAQAHYQDAQREALEELREDTITPDEYEERTETAFDNFKEELGETIDTVEARTEAALTAGVATGNPLLDMGLTALTGAMAGALGLNAHRNRRRKDRGETV